MRKLVTVGAFAAMSLGVACTPEEVQVWQAWNANDPAAAQAFANDYAAQQAAAAAAETPRGVWDRVAECESGGDWSINTGNGYYGGLQFALSSWRAVGGTGYPHQNSRAEQIKRAEILLDQQGWGAWPSCSRQLGLR